MMSINRTNESYFEYPSNLFTVRSAFINVCNEVLPDKIEQIYIELVNKIRELEVILSSIKRSESDMISTRKNINNLSTQNKPDSFGQISDYLSSNGPDLSYEALQGLSEIVNNLLEQRKLYDRNQKNITGLNDKMSESLTNTGIMQEQVKQIISSIMSLCSNLQSLNMSDRLNGITIKEKHINEIMNIPNLSEDTKISLIRYLNDHISLRVKAFRCTEEFAKNIIDNFMNNTLSDSESLKNIAPESWNLLYDALSFDTEAFEKNIVLINDNHSKTLADESNFIYESIFNVIDGKEINTEQLISTILNSDALNRQTVINIANDISNIQGKRNIHSFK